MEHVSGRLSVNTPVFSKQTLFNFSEPSSSHQLIKIKNTYDTGFIDI